MQLVMRSERDAAECTRIGARCAALTPYPLATPLRKGPRCPPLAHRCARSSFARRALPLPPTAPAPRALPVPPRPAPSSARSSARSTPRAPPRARRGSAARRRHVFPLHIAGAMHGLSPAFVGRSPRRCALSPALRARRRSAHLTAARASHHRAHRALGRSTSPHGAHFFVPARSPPRAPFLSAAPACFDLAPRARARAPRATRSSRPKSEAPRF